jgi:hypothetical protein
LGQQFGQHSLCSPKAGGASICPRTPPPPPCTSGSYTGALKGGGGEKQEGPGRTPPGSVPSTARRAPFPFPPAPSGETLPTTHYHGHEGMLEHPFRGFCRRRPPCLPGSRRLPGRTGSAASMAPPMQHSARYALVWLWAGLPAPPETAGGLLARRLRRLLLQLSFPQDAAGVRAGHTPPTSRQVGRIRTLRQATPPIPRPCSIGCY